MIAPAPRIPVSLLTGFLGSGKHAPCGGLVAVDVAVSAFPDWCGINPV